MTEKYVGLRVLRDLSAEDRTCLLDLAVFDWIDADLVDDVLGSSDAPGAGGRAAGAGGSAALHR